MAMYLDIPGILGESQSPNLNWNQKIEIQTMNYSISQNASVQAGGGMIASGANFSYMTFTKAMDKSTTLLFGMLAGGRPITQAIIRVVRAGGAATGSTGGLYEAETYTMTNVIVSNYHTTGVPGPGGLPMENWAFSFTSMVEVYQPVDNLGALQPAQQEKYDVAGGRGTTIS